MGYKRRKIANSPLEMAIAAAAAAVTLGIAVREAVIDSRRYKKQQEEKEAQDKGIQGREDK